MISVKVDSTVYEGLRKSSVSVPKHERKNLGFEHETMSPRAEPCSEENLGGSSCGYLGLSVMVILWCFCGWGGE